MRIYNVSLGKFLSIDPLASGYPWNSVYSFAEGNPIWAIDLDGLEAMIVTYTYDKDGNKILTSVTTDFDKVKETELTVTYVHNYPDDPSKNRTDDPVHEFKTTADKDAANEVIKSMRDFIKLHPDINNDNYRKFGNGYIIRKQFGEQEKKEPTKPVGTKKKKETSKKSKEKVKEKEEEKSIFHPQYQSKFKKNEAELKEILEDAKKMTSDPNFQFNPETDIQWGTEDMNKTNCDEKKKKKWKFTGFKEERIKVKKEKPKS